MRLKRARLAPGMASDGPARARRRSQYSAPWTLNRWELNGQQTSVYVCVCVSVRVLVLPRLTMRNAFVMPAR